MAKQNFWDKVGAGIKYATTGKVPKPVNPPRLRGLTQSPSMAGGNVGYGVEKTDAEYLQDVFGLDQMMAEYLASQGFGPSGGGGRGGGGGGGFGGGGGGGVSAALAAARDLSAANVASTYATASATFDGSPEEYKKIHGAERDVDAGATANMRAGTEQATNDALAKRALQRKVLGIEDAAPVVSDTVVNEQKIANENTDRNENRMVARNAGHLDNALKFNTDLKATVELEGKEKQKQIADFYANQLARISSGGGGGGGGRGGGGRGGGGYGGGSGFNSKMHMTPNKMWDARGELMANDLRRLDAMDGARYRQNHLQNVARQNPSWTPTQQLNTSKHIIGKGPYRR